MYIDIYMFCIIYIYIHVYIYIYLSVTSPLASCKATDRDPERFAASGATRCHGGALQWRPSLEPQPLKIKIDQPMDVEVPSLFQAQMDAFFGHQNGKMENSMDE